MIYVCMINGGSANPFHQTRMMEEANRMIADSTTRLGKAVADLRELVVCGAYRTLGLRS